MSSAAVPSSPSRAGRGDDRRRTLRDALALGGPFVLALGLSLSLAGRPSYWQDEAFTLSATRRPISSLPHLLRDVDAVHGLYYLLVSPWTHIATAPAWVRLPSALATAVAAALVTVLGWQLVDRRTGVTTGLVFAVLPVTSYYGAEARGYALATACSVAATVVLVSATRTGRRRAWVAYGVLVAVSGYAFLFTVLFVVAHLAWLAAVRPRPGAALRFGIAVAAAGVVLAPLLAVGSRQASFQIPWIETPDQGALARVWTTWSSGSIALAVVVWSLTALAVVSAGGRVGRRRRPAVVLGLGMALAPVVLLVGASFVHPVYAPRYVQSSVSGFALLCGVTLARIRRVPSLAVVLVAVSVLGLPAQVRQRQADGHGDTQSSLADVLAQHRQPGDAVLYSPTYWRVSSSAYPESFAGLVDPTAAVDPAVHGDFIGGVTDPDELPGRLAGGRRIWWWHRHGEPTAGSDAALQIAAVRTAGYRVAERHPGRATDLDLLVRD